MGALVAQESNEGFFKQIVQDIKTVTGVDVLKNKKKRSQNLSELRFILMYILRDKGFTLQKIALLIDKDHSTVLYGIKRFEEIISFDKKYKRTFEQIVRLNKSYSRINDIKIHIKSWYSCSNSN